jgi:cytochrome c peroxidase
MTPTDRDKSPAGAGFKVFSDKARCTLCHLPPLFSDTLFHNVGIGYDKEKPDLGRGKHLADAAQKAGQPAPPEAQTLEGAFKTPTLRGAALSGPYFHDGRASTLAEAVDTMLKGGHPNPHLDEKLKPASLTPKERADLQAFLESLTPDRKPYPRPALP